MIKIDKIVFILNEQKFEFTLEELQEFRQEMDRLIASFVKPGEWFYAKEPKNITSTGYQQ